MNAVRAAALAASLVIIAATSWAEEAAPQACKNHYILRCETLPFEWTLAAAPLLDHGSGASATLLADGRVLLAGGLAGQGAEIYDPKVDRWMLAAPMHVSRAAHRAVPLRDGRVLVIGGPWDPHGSRATAEIYDPASNAWTATAPLNFDRRIWWRSDLTANLLADGSVLVTGGNDSWGLARTEAEIYDPASGAWRVTGSLAMGRVGHTATTLADGTVLVVGGLWDWEWWVHNPTAELYDPATGKWHALGDALPRANHTATLQADGRVLIAGGQTPTPATGPGVPSGAFRPYGSTGESFLYDPVNRETASLARSASPRHGHVTITVPGGLLVLGGSSWREGVGRFERVELIERYDADSRTWSPIEEVGDPPYDPYSATHIGERRVLFISPSGAFLLSY